MRSNILLTPCAPKQGQLEPEPKSIVTKWTQSNVTFSDLVIYFKSPKFELAAKHPKLSPLWRDLKAGRAILEALTRLKGLRPPYLDLVDGIDEIADKCVGAETCLLCFESDLALELRGIANNDDLSLDHRCSLINAALLSTIARVVLCITTLSRQSKDCSHLDCGSEDHCPAKA
jgi:hypothetical protein